MAKARGALSRAEIQRNYRQRQKLKDSEAALLKERERWHKRRQEKTVKVITDLSGRQQRAIRKKWREKKAEYRMKKRKQRSETPPSSDDDESDISHQRCRGRKQLAVSRTQSYRQIGELTVSLRIQERLAQKYKRRWQRCKLKMTPSTASSSQSSQANSCTPSSILTPRSRTKQLLRGATGVRPAVRKSLLFHHLAVEHLNTTGKRKQTETVTKKLSRDVLKKYRLYRYSRQNQLPLSYRNQEGKSKVNATDDNTKALVRDFYLRDDNSRITTGKKQTVTKNKLKEQKRLLLDSMLNLHEKFVAESPDNVISYITFTRLRPFWVRIPRASDRDTCMCIKHENVQLAADKLHALGLLKTKYAEDILKQVYCDVNNKACIFRECAGCSDKSVNFHQPSTLNDGNTVFWSEWKSESQEYTKNGEVKTAKLVTKSVRRGTVMELKTELNDAICNQFAHHVFNIRHQFRAYRLLKETMRVTESIIHIDFSENYMCKHSAEVQSAHFGASCRQATIHTGVMYTCNGHTSFASISDSLRHDPSAIWAHLKPVLLDLRANNPDVTTLHFFSDGPTTQYRNKINFYLFSTIVHEMGFESASWNFFESGHGKGAPDAIGGTLKRRADSLVNNGHDVPDATSLYHILKQQESLTKLWFIKESEIRCLDSCHSNVPLKAITGTMKLHQLLTNEVQVVKHRTLSCFCTRPSVCTCYNLKKFKFPSKAAGQVTAEGSCGPADAELAHCPTQPAVNYISPVCGAPLPPTSAATSSLTSIDNTKTADNTTVDAITNANVYPAVPQLPSTCDRSVDSLLSTKQFYRKSLHENPKVEPRPKRLKRSNRVNEYLY
jgi:hypothetical protein